MKKYPWIWLGAAALSGAAGAVLMTHFIQRGQRAVSGLHAALPFQSQLCPTPSGPIEYAEFGDPACPPMLVLHGAQGGFDQGLYFARLMGPQTARFIALSRPGYLRTPLQVGRSPQEQAHAAVAVLDALGVARVGVMGISAGGPAAVWFAHLYPERCWGLLLVSAVAHAWQATWQTQLLNAFPQGEVFRWAVLTYWPTPVLRAHYISPAEQAQFMLNPEAVSGLMAMGLMPDRRRRFGSKNDREVLTHLAPLPFSGVRQPALILHCETDWLVPPSHAHHAIGALPHAQALLFNSGGHLCWFSQHRVTIPTVQAFIQRHAVP